MNESPWRLTLMALLGIALAGLAMALSLDEAEGRELRCVSLPHLLDHLRDRHGEHVISSGRDGQGRGVHLTRAEAGGWTLVVEFVPGLGCIVNAGADSKLDYGI